MKNKLQTTLVLIETSINNITLKGELEYTAKDYCAKITEPNDKGHSGNHLQYAIPAKYILNKSKEMLKSIYLNTKQKKTNVFNK